MLLQWDANHGPSNARLNRPASGGKTGAWSAKTNDLGQWIQVNFRELTRVTEVVIQGRQDYAQWVTAFKLYYSLDGNHFEPQEEVRNGIIAIYRHFIKLQELFKAQMSWESRENNMLVLFCSSSVIINIAF